MGVPAWLSVFLECVLVYVAKGLEECVSHSPYCVGSAASQFRHVCLSFGHVPHPTNASLYFRCTDAGHAACVCRCHYDGMCFDRTTNECVFQWVNPDNGCGPTPQRSPLLDHLVTQATLRPNKPRNKVRDDNVNAVLKNILKAKRNDETVYRPEYGPTPAFTLDFQEAAQAVRQVSRPEDLIIEDNSLFPAWAIALLAFCGVIVVMLVVLILY